MIYQQNTIGGDVAAFDEKNGYREVGRVRLGDQFMPDSVVLSGDHSTLYVNGSNRFYCWQNPEHASESVFVAYDTATFEEKWRVPLHGQIEHFAASPDRRYVYNAHYDKKMVSRVDTHTREVKTINIANLGGHKVRVSADGKKVYVGSIVWASLDEIDTETATWTRNMTFDDNVRPFALSSDGKTAYLQQNRLHGFHVVDLDAFRILKTVDMPGIPDGLPHHEDKYPFTSDHGVEISPDEKYIVFLATTGNYAAIYSYPDLELVKTIPLGIQPSYLTISKDSTRCYVSSRVSGEFHVISLESLEVVHTQSGVGAFPQRICLDH
ncbi:MAG: hypothetical protein AAF610_08205 [Pseudomonadota bacterium]